MRVGVLCAVAVCVGLVWGLHWTIVIPELVLLGERL